MALDQAGIMRVAQPLGRRFPDRFLRRAGDVLTGPPLRLEGELAEHGVLPINYANPNVIVRTADGYSL